MTRFLDGPAKLAALSLKGCPEFLRVCVNRKGKWDALDQPGDSPASDETMYVYRLKSIEQLNAIVLTRGKGGSHSFSRVANYELHAVQPSQEVMQSSMDWADWCREEYARLNGAKS